MAGVYYVTVLPETSKLEQGIREAGRRAESGMKIRPLFDTSGAAQAGQTAGRDIQRGIDSSGAGRIGRMLRIDGAQETGRKAGTEIDRGLSGAKVGAGLNRQIAQEMAPGNASRIGNQYGQQLGNSVESGASGAIKKLGVLLGGLAVGSAVKSGLKSVLEAGMEFENNLNTMGAVSGATEAQLNQVSAKARALGSDASLVGVSAGSAAEAMTELAKGGFTVQQSMDAARGALQLAGAAGVDAATAATIQSDTLHTFALGADQAGKAADILAGAANGSSVEINDIAQSLAAGGSVAHGLGMSLQDTASTIGMFANMGIKGSDAGTSMKTALLQLTNTSKPVVGAFEELGVKAFDAQGKFIGMRGLMDQLNAASKRMTTEQYQAAAATAFGTDGVRFAMLAAQQGTKGFDEMTAAVNRNGVAAEVAAARTKGLPGAWNNFKNQLDGVKLALYDKLKTPLAIVLNYASSAIEKMMPVFEQGAAKIGAFFERNAPAIKSFGAAIAAAFTGKGGGEGGKLLGSLGDAAKELGPALSGVGPAIGEVAKSIGTLGEGALSAVIVPAIRLLGDVLKFAADNASWLGPILAGLLVAIGGLKVANGVAGNLRTLGESMANLFTPLTLIATMAQTRALNAHTAALIQFTIALGGSTGAQNASLLTTIRYNLALGFFIVKQYALIAASKAAAAAQWLWNAAMSANPIMLIVLALVAVGVALWAFFTKTETGRKLWDKIWKGIKAVTQAVVDWIMNTAVPWLKQAWEKIASSAMWLWQNIIKPVFDGIKSVIEAVVGWIMNTAVPWVQKAWKDFSNGLDYIVAVAKEVWNQIKEKFTSIVDFVTGLPAKIRTAASGMWDGIKDAFKGVINWIVRAWNSLSFTIPSIEVFGKKIGGMTLSVPKLAEFFSGGYTGPGGVNDAAGIVHGDEFVVRSVARRKFESEHPGGLDILNRTGALPGYSGGGLVAGAAQLRDIISKKFGISDIGGYRAADGYNEHSTGRALDVMVGSDAAKGDAVKDFALANAKQIGLKWAIWKQTMWYPDGRSEPMEDRGSPTQNHMDHVHIFSDESITQGLGGELNTSSPGSAENIGAQLTGSGGSGSGVGASTSGSDTSSSTGGGTYRTATASELSSAGKKTSNAATAKKNADQSVEDNEFRVKRAKDALDKLKAGKYTATQLEAAERRVTVAERELTDAKERQTKATNNLTEAQQAETELKTKGKKTNDSSDSKDGKNGNGLSGADFGKTFVSGVLESIGLDGSIFSNPFEWPTVKSAMAGVNWLGGIAKGGKGTRAGAATSASAGGFTEGAADAVGLGGFLKTITSPVGQATSQTGTWDPKSGSPKLATSEFNPANTGGTSVATKATSALSTFAPGVVSASTDVNRAGDDNRVIVNAPGQNAEQIYGKFRTEQAARTRTTVVKG